MKSIRIFLLVFLMLASRGLQQPILAKEQDLTDVGTNLQAHFIGKDNSYYLNWSATEKLGAIELLYWRLGNSPENQNKQIRDQILTLIQQTERHVTTLSESSHMRLKVIEYVVKDIATKRLDPLISSCCGKKFM